MKYANVNSATASVEVDGTLTCNTSADSPAVFTAADDNTVGETIYYSPGYPQGNYYANPAIYAPGGVSLSHVRIRYAQQAVWAGDSGSITLSDSEVTDFQVMAVLGWGDGYASPVTLTGNNCLFSGYYAVLVVDSGAYNGGDSYNLNNCTVSGIYYLAAGGNFGNNGHAVNSIFAGVQNAGSSSWQGGYNGFYNSSYVAFGSPQYPTASYPFHASGSDNFYLAADQPFRNVGTTDIGYPLMMDLQTLTTFAPQDGHTADNDWLPDLGYHYPFQDSDHDGLPDWWELYWFGNLNQTGSSLDASGNTLATDYQNYLNGTPTDPNVIQFSISTANNYVNTSSVNVQLNILAGVPSYYAVQLNDTSQSNPVWHAYTGPNLTVPLGSTDGAYDVVVALKGFAANATQTWNDYTVILDRRAPVLAITNLVITNGAVTVIKPYLQLKGNAGEPIASLSYDISNALGVVTNQNAFVTDQYFDPVLLDFTTNYFQCYDIPLTNNVNTVTFRVTDRAGNTTTTNFNVMLDYLRATNPPAVALIWPQDGWEVSGADCTIRGTMSDETGTVVAQVVNGDGTTTTINGIVERNGTFWLEAVPLNGVNQVAVQATDAAGNVTTTNFTIMPSSVTITIDTVPSGDDLWQPTGQVGGTVSDPSATVTVNNKTASVDGQGNWSAADVPIPGGGTATFDAVAQLPGQPPNNKNNSSEKQPYWFLAQYYEDKIVSWSGVGGGVPGLSSDERIKDYQTPYSTNNLGQKAYHGTVQDHHFQIVTGDIFWFESDWDYYANQIDSDKVVDWIYSDTYTPPYHPPLRPDWDYYGQITSLPDEDMESSGGGTWGHPNFVYHYYAENAHYQHHSVNGTDYLDTAAKIPAAHTKWLLLTGGKEGVARMNLWCISADASVNYWGANGMWGTEPVADKTQLQVLGKHVGADGKLWIAIPDSTTPVDITVTAPGADYNAQATPQEYKLVISANGTQLDPDRVVLNTYYMAGQFIGFGASFIPSLPEAPEIDPLRWWFDGNFVNDHSQAKVYSSDDYFMNSAKLSNPSQYNWWLDGADDFPFTKLKAIIAEGLTFANGQYVVVGEKGLFTIKKPAVASFAATINNTSFSVDNNYIGHLGDTCLHLGGAIGLPQGIDWSARVYSPAVIGVGEIAFTQLVKTDRHRTRDDVLSTKEKLTSDGMFNLDDA